jgi:hypothetical protein
MKIETEFPMKSMNEYIEPLFLLVNTVLVGWLLLSKKPKLIYQYM